MRLEGNNVVLRDKHMEDAPDDYRWRTDAELAALDAATPLRASYEEYLGGFRDELRYPFFSSRRLSIETHDGLHIGNCMYYDLSTFRKQAEVGIMIGDRRYWNSGYGYDAMSALLEHMFTSVGLRKVYLHTLEGNQRARRCFSKCGFKEVKAVRRGQHNFVRMEIQRSEWEKLCQSRTAPPLKPETRPP